MLQLVVEEDDVNQKKDAKDLVQQPLEEKRLLSSADFAKYMAVNTSKIYEQTFEYKKEYVDQLHKQALAYQQLMFDQFQEEIAKAQQYFQAITKENEELPARIRKAVLILAQEGWYFSLMMPFNYLWEVEKAIAEKEYGEVDEALIDYFESELDVILKYLCERHPNRAHIITSAMNAHKRKEYVLSIPVLLSQIDGICKERIGHHLFTKRNKRPKTAIYIDQLDIDSYQSALLAPFAVSTPIVASEYERESDFNLLNRHMVLHGESLDYGSQKNSLKALSLLNYIVQSLER
ncbi:hypothetical protein WR37_22060 [Vibrio parahaemolyticus]|nr:hypothetical protein [Vibrio parahaemolyticus]EGR3228803.1 hypothetical protein [Vibrio parahaemolyticus]KKC93557.1 hypothetical protein WR37_22060 [Vibrio parahaemolyticus]KKX64078.1 hypothetical protein UF34_14790 [Vibrio parahaemolyticus]KXZ08117.1 hypothetical protein AT859_23115 [Vibrio parahaemolyticus]